MLHSEAVIFKVAEVTSRGRMIAHVSELALIFMDADLAEVKQLYWDCRIKDKVAIEVWTRARDQRGSAKFMRKTSWIADALYPLQTHVPTWHTLRDVTVADMVGCLVLYRSVVLTRYLQRLLETAGRGSEEG